MCSGIVRVPLVRRCLLFCTAFYWISGSGCFPARTPNPEREQGARIESVPSVEEILEWLPPDTETLIVARGPIELEYLDLEQKQIKTRPLEKKLQALSYAPLWAQNGLLLKILARQKLVLAINGARRLQGQQQSCGVFVFAADLGRVGETLRQTMSKEAKRVEHIGVNEVSYFESVVQKDVWRSFLVQTKANVLIHATDRGFLEQMLKRMEHPSQPAALPAELPEWKLVDRAAHFWALRHFNKAEPDVFWDGSRLDEQAGGFVFTFDPDGTRRDKPAPKVTYVTPADSDRRFALELATKSWTVTVNDRVWTPKIELPRPGIIEIAPELKNEDDRAAFLLMLFLHLGYRFKGL